MNQNRMSGEITPDPNRLDDCWVNQVQLRLSYGFELADAKKDLSQAKTDLELVSAELDNEIRTSPEDFGLEKVTETAIKAAIPNNPRYKKVKQKVIDCQHDVDVLGVAMDAIEDRKYALKDLVQLRMADYYGAPRATEGAREAMEEITKASVRRRGRE